MDYESNQPEPLKSRKSSNVPGQSLGYSLQHTRFMAKLLTAQKGDSISLEVFEDVGLEDKQGNKTYEQSKSVGSEGNPIADRSIDLWKTFSNWIDAAKRDGINDNHKFEIYVSRKKEGRICESFSKANSIEEAIEAVENARLFHWGAKPENLLKETVAKSISTYVDNFMTCDSSVLALIIKNFTVSFGSGSPQTDLLSLLRGALVPEVFLEDVLYRGLGWIKRQTDLLLEKQEPAVLMYDNFHLEMTAYVGLLNNSKVLSSRDEEISEDLIQLHLYNSVYIEQLAIIECDYEDKLCAVNDYLRAYNDRSHWSELGIIHRKSLDSFEALLMKTWNNLKKIIEIKNDTIQEVKKGELLFRECSNYNQKLQGLDVPEHFTSGSFHSLSNAKVMGWHPRYNELLKTRVLEEGN
ncbi:ABC-three component system protein [Paenibacillus radicis (ex Xue et al. 2023)]|uniref:ABC-three component systems C-terminal domain-containing protein n=1 Tax=Paenibacillus radicis (ex Xue et al. 2023) TaxID=2972489 RepID=A0ABT1YBZ1_9BACL|nr:ABC-three component system protein [Paenibacillus radicis (ex Xue et al. 2023)]MCR8630714.1 hypothetical protein [Paenibacillus radicis (ex Xue et al. 2023)]